MSIRKTSTLASAILVVSGLSALAHDDGITIEEMVDMFEQDVIVSGPGVVNCTLSGGTKTTCVSITVKSNLSDDEMGPWCPTNIADGADKGGIWLESGKAHDVDGNFIKNLSTFYKDDNWKLFDADTGEINVTNSKESCEAAARPDVDEKYFNYCVECKASYLDGDVNVTYVVPEHPVEAKNSEDLGGGVPIGVALNGVKFDGPAPVEFILKAYTIAAFDDCGGHVNPHEGYHYHAAGGCSPEVAADAEHAPIIGVALDGYPLTSRLNKDGNAPSDLDQCLGHTTQGLGYHYHVNEMGSNQTIQCFKGEYGCSSTDGVETCDASAVVRRGPPPGAGGLLPKG